MRLVYASALAAAIALTIPVVNAAPQPQDPDRKVAGGGITAANIAEILERSGVRHVHGKAFAGVRAAARRT